MLSDKRIQYFIETNYNDLKENEYDELVANFFKAKKEDWFKQFTKKNNDITQEWDPELVKTFWHLIRTHAMPHMLNTKHFYFKNFIFPKFESSPINTKNNYRMLFDGIFWHSGNERSFKNNITFHNCEFLGNINFSYTIFHQDLFFIDCEVNWKINFTKLISKRAIIINDSSFYFDTIFNESQIHNLHIHSSFFNGTYFNKIKVKGEFYLTNVNFNGNFTLTEVEFSREVKINYSNFNHGSYFRNVAFNNEATFKTCDFSLSSATFFTDINSHGNCFYLNGCSFGDNTIFRRVDFKHGSLVQSNFEKASFINCYWSFSTSRHHRFISSNRLVLEDENFIPDDLPDKLGELEELYRLLKTNFEKKHSWELSGKAYISEMEMRRKSFLTEKDYLQWFIYSFYKFAGYTQNFKRPLLILLILTFFVFPLLYSDLCFLFYDHCHWNWDSLRKSLDASLPIFKPSLEYKYWGIRYLQSFISTIFLTFFILALRKRFKQ